MPMLTERTLAYLRDHNVMTLATNGPEGLWAAAVFYVNVDFRLYFLSSPTTRHSLNIAARPAVAATIQEDYGDWLAIKG
ncbi:MAG: pyridoxamine 5'-phosphate oxidase, partial [Chloroflexi bacterium]|nr:pyridoxamine 5'-phosphate oxidase [Chloroflexota bacterium]